MIDALKRWIEKIKSSPILKPFIATKNWFQQNVIKRKLVIFSALFTVWISLLLGAIYSPQRQTYTDEQLKTKQIFPNGTGEISLVSQEYSPKTGIIVLQFETSDSTSPVNRGIEGKRLEWHLYAQNKSSETVMEVVPIIDNKISVIIRNVPKDFGAFAIDIINHTVATNSIDINISSPSDNETEVEDRDVAGNLVQFFVTPQNEQLKKSNIVNVSREEFTLQEIEDEANFQSGQIEKINESIKQLKVSIEDDESRKSSLLVEAKYLSGEELETNQRDIATIENNIGTKNSSIETAYGNIDKVQAKLATLEKKKQAVKDGTFEFSNPIETVEMK